LKYNQTASEFALIRSERKARQIHRWSLLTPRVSQKGHGAPCPYGVSRYSVSLIINYLQRPELVFLSWTRAGHLLLRYPLGRRGAVATLPTLKGCVALALPYGAGPYILVCSWNLSAYRRDGSTSSRLTLGHHRHTSLITGWSGAMGI